MISLYNILQIWHWRTFLTPDIQIRNLWFFWQRNNDKNNHFLKVWGQNIHPTKIYFSLSYCGKNVIFQELFLTLEHILELKDEVLVAKQIFGVHEEASSSQKNGFEVNDDIPERNGYYYCPWVKFFEAHEKAYWSLKDIPDVNDDIL